MLMVRLDDAQMLFISREATLAVPIRRAAPSPQPHSPCLSKLLLRWADAITSSSASPPSVIAVILTATFFLRTFCPCGHRLVGLVVRRPPRERKIPVSNPACAGIFSGSSHTSDLKIGTPVTTLPGAWHYRVSAGTGRPGVSIL